MLEGIAFLAIVTAAITSTFVARAQSERAQAEDADEATQDSRVEGRLDELAAQLDQVESMLRELGNRLAGSIGEPPELRLSPRRAASAA